MKKVLVGLISVATIALLAMPALAGSPRHRDSGSDIKVENDNYANVNNTLYVEAYTGPNEANGDDGGNGGGTGSAMASGYFSDAVSGDGGNGGAGGDGGSVTSGAATANGTLVNVANTNYTKIKASCRRGCTGDIKVENDDNEAFVVNYGRVVADTGLNEAKGDDGGNGGGTGSADASWGGAAASGDGGNGGSGGDGGTIRSGSSAANGTLVNVVNTNITRIRR